MLDRIIDWLRLYRERARSLLVPSWMSGEKNTTLFRGENCLELTVYASTSNWEEYIITFRNSITLIAMSQIKTMTGRFITGMEANEFKKQNTDN